MKIRIAIDGPSGAGKSSLARAVAGKMGILYVDTGALYRAVGLYARGRGITLENIKDTAGILGNLNIEMKHGDGGQRVYICGEEAGERLREHEISSYASAVSALPEVRAFLLGLQRDAAARQSVVMDGRDIGTVIIPDAEVKIFLTASEEERARRRHAELAAKGSDKSYEVVLRDIRERDRNDRTREAAPAVAAPDAVILDNTGFNADQTLSAAMDIINKAAEKLGGYGK